MIKTPSRLVRMGWLALLGLMPLSARAAEVNYAEGVRLAKQLFKAGHLVKARQVITKVAMNMQYPTCGEGRVDAHLISIAFPPKDALHVCVAEYGHMSYFDFTGSRLKPVWQVGTGDGKSNKKIVSNNIFISQYFGQNSQLIYECGKQPGAATRLIVFQNTAPLGSVSAGILTPQKFDITLDYAFDPGAPHKPTTLPDWYEFKNWIAKVPGE